MRSLVVVLMLLAPIASADSYAPSHDCTEPDIPYEFEDQYERDQFVSDAEEYQSCISDFVDDQEEAIRKHKAAAEEAIEEWNSFSRSI